MFGLGAGQSSHSSPNSSAAVLGTGPGTGETLVLFLAETWYRSPLDSSGGLIGRK
jgi:hypothetical protein